MSEQSAEVQLALMAKTIEQQGEQLKTQEARISKMEDERNRALIWGIVALGGLVVGLLGWFGSLLMKDHVR